ncbi:DUF4928 family protein [Coriobacterium glomerans]|nr:DUF4928 family protein [Coriobacterium glomerans]
MVQITRAFSEDSLPIDPREYVTGRQGQVDGLGEGNLRKILKEHDITRQLAKEAGRTDYTTASSMTSKQTRACISSMTAEPNKERSALSRATAP